MYLESALLRNISGITHGFGTRHEPIPSRFVSAWEARPQARQVHNAAVARVIVGAQTCGEVDAFVSDRKGIPLAVVTADCVPILLARDDGLRVAAIHAGWRGTYAKIIRNVFKELESGRGKANRWVAAIGPSARGCCYEVSPELAREFSNEFREYPERDFISDGRYLDLARLNRLELEALGVTRIDVLPYCTLCSKEPTFFSFRREKVAVRQYSAIQIL